MIYFIRSGHYIKIGVSARPWERLSEFQTANPEPLEMLAVAPGAPLPPERGESGVSGTILRRPGRLSGRPVPSPHPAPRLP